MKLRRLDQLVAGFAEGDAISLEARMLRDVAREMGLESDIFAPLRSVGARVAGQCRPVEEYEGRDGGVLLFHYSTASEATERFLAARAVKVVRYHNITPSPFFHGFDGAMVRQLQEARAGLSRVAAAADGIWADSDFNAQEIRELGIGPVQVVPLVFSLQSFKQSPEAGTMARFGGELKNILFVGRMVPNKCVDELILAFAWYHRRIEPRSRLILVGSDRSCPRYYAMLRMLAARLELPNVCFEGFQSDARLAASYERADVYVCTSRHEGYCLPLVEAMSHDVPVVARATGGMPETMGGAGVLFEDMDSRVLAELIHRVASDDSLRRRIRASQQRRLTEMGARDIRGELVALLKGRDS